MPLRDGADLLSPGGEVSRQGLQWLSNATESELRELLTAKPAPSSDEPVVLASSADKGKGKARAHSADRRPLDPSQGRPGCVETFARVCNVPIRGSAVSSRFMQPGVRGEQITFDSQSQGSGGPIGSSSPVFVTRLDAPLHERGDAGPSRLSFGPSRPGPSIKRRRRSPAASEPPRKKAAPVLAGNGKRAAPPAGKKRVAWSEAEEKLLIEVRRSNVAQLAL